MVVMSSEDSKDEGLITCEKQISWFLTTVIEVGVDVPKCNSNAWLKMLNVLAYLSYINYEASAGRGADQFHCLLMSSSKLKPPVNDLQAL